LITGALHNHKISSITVVTWPKLRVFYAYFSAGVVNIYLLKLNLKVEVETERGPSAELEAKLRHSELEVKLRHSELEPELGHSSGAVMKKMMIAP